MEPFKVILNGRMEKLKKPARDAVSLIAKELKGLFDQLLETYVSLP